MSTTARAADASTNKPTFDSRWNFLLFFFTGADVPHVYMRASTLRCFQSYYYTQTFRRALTASVDSCAKILGEGVHLQWRHQFWQSLEKGCWKAKLYVHHSSNCKSMAWTMLGPVSSPELSAGLWPLLPHGSVSELTPSLPWRQLKTTNKSAKFGTLKPFCAFSHWLVPGFSSKGTALKVDVLLDQKIYCLQARQCIVRPGNLTGCGGGRGGGLVLVLEHWDEMSLVQITRRN